MYGRKQIAFLITEGPGRIGVTFVWEDLRRDAELPMMGTHKVRPKVRIAAGVVRGQICQGTGKFVAESLTIVPCA